MITCGFYSCFFFLGKYSRIFVDVMQWSQDIPSKEESSSQLRALYTHFFFKNI